MHKKLRKENNCLNCGHIVEDVFCSHCGQENLELHESTWHLFAHYFQDLVHYDGRFWHTFKNLFTRPGYVAREYIEGRRVRNLKPIPLYVFASSVFFIVFFLIGPKINLKNQKIDDGARHYQAEKLSTVFKSTPLQSKADSFYSEYKKIEAEKTHEAYLADSIVNTEQLIQLQAKLKKRGINTSLDSLIQNGKDEAKEDSLDELKSDNKWLNKGLKKIFKKKEDVYEGDDRKMVEGMVTEFLHSLSKIFFISLPFFAFFLWLLHPKKTKRQYAQHLIFALYHYSYVFIVALLALILNYLLGLALPKKTANDISEWILFIVFMYLLIYLGFSMKQFYNESLTRAFAKETIALVLSSILMLVLLVALAGFLVAF